MTYEQNVNFVKYYEGKTIERISMDSSNLISIHFTDGSFLEIVANTEFFGDNVVLPVLELSDIIL